MKQSVFEVDNSKKCTTERMVRAGNYDEVNYLITEGIKKGKFPIQHEVKGRRKIVVLDDDCDFTSQEVIIEAKRMSLSRPTYTDAFLFGEQHPCELRNDSPIVFLHDPAYYWNAYFFYLVLNAKHNRRQLRLVSSGDRWPGKYRFAFVDNE